MDELKGKFKNLLSKASGRQPGFEGQGHRLGTAQEHGVKPKVQGQAVVASSTAAAAGSSSARAAAASSSSSARAPAAQQRSQRPAPVSPAAGVHDLKPSTEFDPFTAVIGSGAALSAGLASPAPPAEASSSNAPARPGAGSSSSSGSSSNAPVRPPQAAPRSPPLQPLETPQQQVSLAAVTDEQLDEIRHSLALIASQPAAAAGCMQVLSKLLGNLAAAPQEAKFRHIRLANPKISSSVVGVSGGLELLAASGFQVHRTQPTSAAAAAAAGADDQDDDFAVFLDDSHLSLVHAALQQLQATLPAAIAATPPPPQQQQQLVPTPAPAAAPAAAAAGPAAAVQPPVPAVDRDTQVLLPAVPDTDVPPWFFERTPADVKAEYASMLSRRARGELFASKAWKDAQAGRGQAVRPTVALVRVRFPEGVCLQGRFHVRERLDALYAWVTDAQRDAGIPYELVGPDRRRLDPGGSTVESAQLAPAALVSFRPLGAAGAAGYQLRDAAGRAVSYLRDELLQQARAD